MEKKILRLPIQKKLHTTYNEYYIIIVAMTFSGKIDSSFICMFKSNNVFLKDNLLFPKATLQDIFFKSEHQHLLSECQICKKKIQIWQTLHSIAKFLCHCFTSFVPI